jgi:hypothetical protein
MIGNIIVLLGILFVINIFIKAKKTVKDINTSRENIERVFLHLSNKV